MVSDVNLHPYTKYALYEDEKGNWRIQAIPLTPSSFENRKPLPSAWRGVRDDELSKLSARRCRLHTSG